MAKRPFLHQWKSTSYSNLSKVLLPSDVNHACYFLSRVTIGKRLLRKNAGFIQPSIHLSIHLFFMFRCGCVCVCGSSQTSRPFGRAGLQQSLPALSFPEADSLRGLCPLPASLLGAVARSAAQAPGGFHQSNRGLSLPRQGNVHPLPRQPAPQSLEERARSSL